MIYQSPLGPVWFNLSYFDGLKEPWAWSLNFGYILFNQKARIESDDRPPFLDVYEAAGDPDRASAENNGLVAAWTIADELLQDLHMIKFGYTTDGYDRHVDAA
jgi:hypothetical protein